MLATLPLLNVTDVPVICRRATALQVNLGYRRNLRCAHSHVNAGPYTTEMLVPELYDFNQQVDLRLAGAPRLHLLERDMDSKAICVADHRDGSSAGPGNQFGVAF